MPTKDPAKEATTFIFTKLQQMGEVVGEMEEFVSDSNENALDINEGSLERDGMCEMLPDDIMPNFRDLEVARDGKTSQNT